MKHRYIFGLSILALFGAGCEIPAATTPPIAMPGAEKPSKTPPAASGELCAELPQVYFFNKLAFSASEISSINTNVVTPLVEYFEGLPDYKVVSVKIERTATGITVEAIVDQPDSSDPVFHAFVHPRTGGSYPMWYPEEVPPGYRG